MYLSAYHFEGDPNALSAAYDRLRAAFPTDDSDLHLLVVRAEGITVVDSCPSREAFERFSGDERFRAAVAEAGLPAPRVEPLGEVTRAVIARADAAR